MQNQDPSVNNPFTPAPGTPPPAQYPYPPPPSPDGSVPAQFPPPPNGVAPAPYPYSPPLMTNGPILGQDPYLSPYQQYYPSYTPATRSTTGDVIKSSLIGGSIAAGIDVLITLLLVFVPAIGRVVFPLYQFAPLLPANMLSVGEFIVSLILGLLCSPGLFVVGLRTIRKTGRMSSVMLACTLALVGFAVVDFLLIIATAAYDLTAFPSSSASATLEFWGAALLGWLPDLIMVSIVGFGAAALGATIGKRRS